MPFDELEYLDLSFDEMLKIEMDNAIKSYKKMQSSLIKLSDEYEKNKPPFLNDQQQNNFNKINQVMSSHIRHSNFIKETIMENSTYLDGKSRRKVMERLTQGGLIVMSIAVLFQIILRP